MVFLISRCTGVSQSATHTAHISHYPTSYSLPALEFPALSSATHAAYLNGQLHRPVLNLFLIEYQKRTAQLVDMQSREAKREGQDRKHDTHCRGPEKELKHLSTWQLGLQRHSAIRYTQSRLQLKHDTYRDRHSPHLSRNDETMKPFGAELFYGNYQIRTTGSTCRSLRGPVVLNAWLFLHARKQPQLCPQRSTSVIQLHISHRPIQEPFKSSPLQAHRPRIY